MVEAVLDFLSGLFATTWHGLLFLASLLAIVLGVLWPSLSLVVMGVVGMIGGYVLMKMADRRDKS